MGKFDGVLLVSDFDNTVVDTASAFQAGRPTPAVSARTVEALRHFTGCGGRFTIATGRALASFVRLAPSVPMNAPAVLCNGAALYDFAAQAYLETNMLDEAACRRAQAALDRFPEVAVEAYHIANTIYAVQPNEITRRHIHVTHVEITEAPTLLQVPTPLGKILFEGPEEALRQVQQQLEQERQYELIFSAPTLLEMTAPGAHKGGMVRRLAQRLGISMEHVYCVGDEANDLSMLAEAAEGFAPANCTQAVRASGVTLVSDAAHDALADVVEILEKKYA